MDFWEKYTPDTQKSTEFSDDEAGHFETYGPDMDYVLGVFARTPERVWTVIDREDDDWNDSPLIVNGLRYCNRIFYIVTVEGGSEGETHDLY